MGHRDALLEGARRCLEEKGYGRTTARDLVEASGTNLGSIGYHFGSKEALLNAAIAEGFEEWVSHVTRVATANPNAPPLERLTVTWATMLDEFPQIRPLLVGLMEAVAQAERSQELRTQLAAHYERCRAEITTVIRESVADAAITPSNIDVLASFMIAVADGFAIQFLLDPARSPTGAQLGVALATGLGALDSAPRDVDRATAGLPAKTNRRRSAKRR